MPEYDCKRIYKLGVISDTHGLLRPTVVDLLSGCDYIVHAGDIDKPAVLGALEAVAPVVAVKGNNDYGAWADVLEEQVHFTVGGVQILLIHNKGYLPASIPQTDVVIFGHSHRYYCETRDGILWLNPGSCGRQRFGGALSMAMLEIENGQCHVGRVDLPMG